MFKDKPAHPSEIAPGEGRQGTTTDGERGSNHEEHEGHEDGENVGDVGWLPALRCSGAVCAPKITGT